MTRGYFFNNTIKKRNDSNDLVGCMEKTVQKLLECETNSKKPGILLGKIQSGKTRAFIGIIALAFDNGYDIAVILTKGTKALARQTVQRLENDFSDFIENDKIQVFDIMNFPNNLTKYELDQKIVIVAKKEINNMKKVIESLTNIYPELKNAKILIVDDEADYASVSFRKNRETGIVEAGKISNLIDIFRTKVVAEDYLQVTATPYSLYLQPDDKIDNFELVEFLPRRPSFTVLLPIHQYYIGGDHYFNDNQNPDSTSFYLFEEVSPEEREILKKPDRRKFKIEEVLVSKNISVLRKAIMNFIVGAVIRRLQQEQQNLDLQKYSFIAHSEISKASHEWQRQIIERLIGELLRISKKDVKTLDNLVRDSYKDLSRSILLVNDTAPELGLVQKKVLEAIKGGYIMNTVVNSERETDELLDRKGELKLRTPLNIFIGGQILDRGITINNLIGFYYGRSPKKFQQDTVLQHSRMYGTRDPLDLSVTRFYTTLDIYGVMKRIHDFDTALREAFKRGDHKNGVYFIRKDLGGKLLPCSPNKLVISNITTLKPYKRLLPVGFQTGYKSNIRKDIQKLDQIIDGWFGKRRKEDPILVRLSKIQGVIELIDKTLLFEKGYEWDKRAFRASIEHLSLNSEDETKRGMVWVLVREDRNLKRIKEDGGFSDAPDTPKTEGAIAKNVAIDLPMVLLFRQNGSELNGWMGSPFWWPVLMAQKNTKTTIFDSTINEREDI